jgi:hypothetical protein
VRVSCSHDCTGRRTSGAAEPCGDATGIADYLARSAYLEAVSVVAFERLAREISAHGAPEELTSLARRAAREEVEHADAVWRLASIFGATAPIERPSLVPSEVRSLYEIAVENAVEGCVRETYGAAVGVFRAARATDAAVREAMQAIAEEECGHAELSWRILRWTLSQLDEAERRAMGRAMRDAREALLDDIGREVPLAPEDALRLGIPTREEKLGLLRLVEDRAFFLSA